MRAAVIVFPGSNCDRDMAVALSRAGFAVTKVWHADTALPPTDLVALPGGFAWGDYLRPGAIAARAAILPAVATHARRGGLTLGVCNGFQVLVEAGLLPGALMRNTGLRFVCRDAALSVTGSSAFTARFRPGATVRFPIAHHDGAWTTDADTLARLEGDGRVAFRYVDNPNGSAGDVAGITSADRRTLGLMPHPERAVDSATGGTDGAKLFQALAGAVGHVHA